MKILMLGLIALFAIDIIDRSIEYWFYNVDLEKYEEVIEDD